MKVSLVLEILKNVSKNADILISKEEVIVNDGINTFEIKASENVKSRYRHQLDDDPDFE